MLIVTFLDIICIQTKEHVQTEGRLSIRKEEKTHSKEKKCRGTTNHKEKEDEKEKRKEKKLLSKKNAHLMQTHRNPNTCNQYTTQSQPPAPKRPHSPYPTEP